MTELLVEVREGVGILTLNRPERINALTRAMVDQMAGQLRRWAGDPQVSTVELRGAGQRGFCAGADVRTLRDAAVAGRADEVLAFLLAEYDLDQQIAEYPKPVVAHLAGVSMGGGLGIGMHGTHRVGEPGTRWAMPETAIGLWPDVGVCFEMSRTPGRVGEHLAMTGEVIDAASALWAGLLDECPGVQPESSRLAASSSWIDQCYRHDDAVSIVRALEADAHPDAQAAARTIRTRSPLAVVTALRAVRQARQLPDVAAVLEQDRALARALVGDSADFIEGVRARMIDRDGRPRWRHARLEDVDPAEVDARFSQI